MRAKASFHMRACRSHFIGSFVPVFRDLEDNQQTREEIAFKPSPDHHGHADGAFLWIGDHLDGVAWLKA